MKRISAALLVAGPCRMHGHDLTHHRPARSARRPPRPRPLPTTKPTATASEAPTAASETVPPEPTSDLGDFICTYPYAVDGNADRAQIDDVRVGSHSGYDRIVFQFEKGIPALDVKVGKPPFTRDPSGLPMPVAGKDFLVFLLRGGTGLGPSGRGHLRRPDGLHAAATPMHSVQFIQAGDFEAQSEWVAGLTGPACIRVFALTDPDRLVVDLEARSVGRIATRQVGRPRTLRSWPIPSSRRSTSSVTRSTGTSS